MNAYELGGLGLAAQVLGADAKSGGGMGFTDFIPIMSLIDGFTGGKSGANINKSTGSSSSSGASSSSPNTSTTTAPSGASTQELVRAAIEQERQRLAVEKTQADVKRMQMFTIGAAGVLGLGIAALILRRK